MSRALLYGLRVQADFDLHQPRANFGGRPDVVIITGRPLDDDPVALEGTLLLNFEPGLPWYRLVKTPDAYHFRVYDVCDFVVAPTLDRVELRMHPSASPGMDSVMTTGTLLSLLIWLRGSHVLHGSAVELEGVGIGFVGHSGQGKTTMATALCAEGAAMITDDVLVVDRGADGPRVRRGSSELRLRPGADALVAAIGSLDSERVSADDRRVISPRVTVQPTVPLAALVIPDPTKDGSEFRLESVPRSRAALALLHYPRLMGWLDEAVLQAGFHHVLALASEVPVFVAHVPWGRFPEHMGRAILDAAEERTAVSV